jgi:DNA-binding response OmpR family regulator
MKPEEQATVLVIDDDPALRDVIRRALERDGHRVITAHEGEEGLRAYRSEPCDIVVTDLFMPGKDGIETIQELRLEFPEARIIAMSGGASTRDMGPLMDARLLGADVAMPKPFPMASLSRAVKTLLHRDPDDNDGGEDGAAPDHSA